MSDPDHDYAEDALVALDSIDDDELDRHEQELLAEAKEKTAALAHGLSEDLNGGEADE